MKRFAFICLAMASVAGIGAAAGPEYHLVAKTPISPAQQIFDYAAADSVNRRVYLAHGDEFVVVDADSNAVVGRIPAPENGQPGRPTNCEGAHHVAIAADLGRGFTANGCAGTSTIFDLKSLQKIGEVRTGDDPNCAVYDAATKRIFVFNVNTHDVTVIDAASGMVLKTIELNGKPAFAASDDRGHVFVNLMDKNLVQRINARALVGDGRWPVGCKGPQNETMAIDKVHGRLFVGCRPDFRRMRFAAGPSPDRIMQVMDTANGRVVATVPIGGNPDEAAFDPGLGLALSANGEGSITVIKQDTPNKYHVLQTVATEPGAARLTVDVKTHKIFVPNNDQDPSGYGPNFRVLVFAK